MIETLRYLPEEHPGYETVVEILTAQCEALLDRQDRSGFWYHILDYPDSPLRRPERSNSRTLSIEE